MPKKISNQQLSRAMKLVFQGYTQAEAAAAVGIHQSTISLHMGEFKSLVQEKGLQLAAEEYGLVDTIEDMLGLGAALKKNRLSVKDAKAGVKAGDTLQKLGVQPEQYSGLVNACKKMEQQGFLAAAIKLADLEEATGANYEQLVDQHKQIQADLAEKTSELDSVSAKLASMEHQKTAAGEELHEYLAKVGADMERIKLVEHLAKAFKEAGISDTALAVYLKRQQVLNEAAMDIGLFTNIVKQSKLVTAIDGGKGLLQHLEKYNGLTGANAGLEARSKVLTENVVGLEKQSALKAKIELETTKLKAEKADLQVKVADLRQLFETRMALEGHINYLTSQKKTLEQGVGQLRDQHSQLESDVAQKKEYLSDILEFKSQRAALVKEITEREAAVKKKEKAWTVFQGFLGIVSSTSKAELKKSLELLSSLPDSLPDGSSPDGLEATQATILQTLTQGKLYVALRCETCGIEFIVDREKPGGSYRCPNEEFGKPHLVMLEKSALRVMKRVLGPEEKIQVMPFILKKQK